MSIHEQICFRADCDGCETDFQYDGFAQHFDTRLAAESYAASDGEGGFSNSGKMYCENCFYERQCGECREAGDDVIEPDEDGDRLCAKCRVAP